MTMPTARPVTMAPQMPAQLSRPMSWSRNAEAMAIRKELKLMPRFRAAISSVWEAPRFTRTAYTPNRERMVPRAAISMGVRTALIAISGTAM